MTSGCECAQSAHVSSDLFATACSGCDDPQLCYLEPDFPAEPVCCNFYDEAGMCFPECPASTVTNGKECLTECPAGLYNVSGVCGKLAYV